MTILHELAAATTTLAIAMAARRDNSWSFEALRRN
jgi:hypothetical protein